MMKYDKQKGFSTAPFSVNISVTEKCPLRCPVCFQKYDQSIELEFEQVCQYLDELSALGTRYVQFSGGEPLSYPYLLNSIEYAKKKGFITRISTSGVGMTRRVAEKLKDSGLDYCHVSLNGSNAYIHELTRSGFNEALNALNVLSHIDISVSINWVASHANISDLPNLIAMAKALQVSSISVLQNKENNAHLHMYPMTKKDLYLLKEYCLENKDYLVVESCFIQLNELLNRDKVKIVEQGCRAGRFYMAISARGEFLPCPRLTNYQSRALSIDNYWKEDKHLEKLRKLLNTNSIEQRGCSAHLLQIGKGKHERGMLDIYGG